MTKKEKIIYILNELIEATKLSDDEVVLDLSDLPMTKTEAYSILKAIYIKHPIALSPTDMSFFLGSISPVCLPDVIKAKCVLFLLEQLKKDTENLAKSTQLLKEPVYIKANTEKDDVTFGDGYHITSKGVIYKDGKIVCRAQSAGYYLVCLLKKSPKGAYGKDYFEKNNKCWATVKKSRGIIMKHCGNVIGTNAEGEYYWLG